MRLKVYLAQSSHKGLFTNDVFMSGDFQDLCPLSLTSFVNGPLVHISIHTLESFPPGVILVVLCPVQYELTVAVEVAVVVIVKLGADQVRLARYPRGKRLRVRRRRR